MSRSTQVRSRKTLEAILDSAERVIVRDGAISLTLDAVAAESGVSKGGVQHHFRSKEALVTALVSRKLTAVSDGMEAEEKGLSDHRSRVVLSMLRHGLRQWTDEKGFPPALLLAAALNSESLGEVQAFIDAKIERIRVDMDDADRAIVFLFASFGLLLTRALGFSKLSGEDGLRLFEAMESFIEPLK